MLGAIAHQETHQCTYIHTNSTMMLSVEKPTDDLVRLVVRRSIVAVRVAGVGTEIVLGLTVVETLADHSSFAFAFFIINLRGHLTGSSKESAVFCTQ